MINGLYVNCDSCKREVKQHSLTYDCETHRECNSIAAGKMVSQITHGSSLQSSSITVPTGGRPISIANITSPLVSSSIASLLTKRWSSDKISYLRDQLTAGEDHCPLIDEV
uniref:Uncharacterized protein n=1 Tax=Amphimedon queenslandica TaxID=400682 RepID=A0A1X7UEZ3_AMPQE